MGVAVGTELRVKLTAERFDLENVRVALLASFPGLSRFQFLMYCSMHTANDQKLEPGKGNRGRPGNQAIAHLTLSQVLLMLSAVTMAARLVT